jgi:hypothetical protein
MREVEHALDVRLARLHRGLPGGDPGLLRCGGEVPNEGSSGSISTASTPGTDISRGSGSMPQVVLPVLRARSIANVDGPAKLMVFGCIVNQLGLISRFADFEFGSQSRSLRGAQGGSTWPRTAGTEQVRVRGETGDYPANNGQALRGRV